MHRRQREVAIQRRRERLMKALGGFIIPYIPRKGNPIKRLESFPNNSPKRTPTLVELIYID